MTVLWALICCVIVTDAELSARKAELGADSEIVDTSGDDTSSEDDPAQDSVTLIGVVSAPLDAMLRSGSARVGLIPVDLAAPNLVDAVPGVWAAAPLTGLLAGASGDYRLDSLNPPQDLGAPFGADPAARGALFALVAWVDTNKDGAFDLGEQPIDMGLTRLLAYAREPSEGAVAGGLPAGYSLVTLDVTTRALSDALQPTDQRLSLNLSGALLPQGPSTYTLAPEKSVEDDLIDVEDAGRVALVGHGVLDQVSGFPVLVDAPYDGDGDQVLSGPFAEPEEGAFSTAWAASALTARQVQVAAFIGLAYEDRDGDGELTIDQDDVFGCSCEDRDPRALVFVRPLGFQAALAREGLGGFGWLTVDDDLPMSEAPTRYSATMPINGVRGAWR